MVSVRNLEIPTVVVVVLVLAAAYLLWPFAGPLVLAIWLSGFAHGLHERITHRIGGRVHLAAFLTVLVLMTVLVPIGAVVTLLVIDAIALVSDLAKSDQAQSVLVSLVTQRDANPDASIRELILAQGGRAFGIARTIFSGAAQAVIALVVLIFGIYAILVDGHRWYAWFDQHAPIGSTALRRLADAFTETGRGLVFGIVGAGLLQALAATAAYIALQVPQALALGFLTLLFSIVPLVGTAAVWVPVAAGLAMSGRVAAGIGLAVFGILVIGSIDNLARPWLARRGKLQLPTFVVLVSMFGAIEVFGGWGVIFGPLFVRLAKEALELRREAELVV